MLDTNNTSHEPEYLGIALCAILACLGGIARELSNFESCFNVKRFFSTLFVASFSGIIIGLFLPDFTHKNWILALSGMSGVVGVSIIDYFTDVFKVILLHSIKHITGQEIDFGKKKKKAKIKN